MKAMTRDEYGLVDVRTEKERRRTKTRESRTATAFGLIRAGLVIASGMPLIYDAGVVALG